MTVDVRNAFIPPCCFERLAQQPGISHTVFHNGSIAVEAQANKIVILCDNLGARSRKVQGIALFSASKVIEFEDEMFRKVGFIAPDDPPNASVDKSELVTRSID